MKNTCNRTILIQTIKSTIKTLDKTKYSNIIYKKLKSSAKSLITFIKDQDMFIPLPEICILEEGYFSLLWDLSNYDKKILLYITSEDTFTLNIITGDSNIKYNKPLNPANNKETLERIIEILKV